MERQEIIFLNAVFFVLGFTLVFAAIGVLFQTLLAHAPHSVKVALVDVGGIIIIGFGVLLLLSSRYIIPFFSTEHKIHARRYSNSYLSSFVFGIGFALGWTPCVGAILGSIYALAASEPGIGLLLLLAYSVGLGVPFLVFGAFMSRLAPALKRMRGALRYFNIAGGVFLIVMGLLVVTGYIGLLSVFLIGPQPAGSVSGSLNFLLAMAAGAITFFSPCILPLLPAFLSYMAGTSAEASA